MKKYKVSIVGLGRIADHYLNLINSKSFKNISISSVCDNKKRKLVNFSKSYKKVPTFNNLEELLNNDQPDLLIISTPSGIHYKNAELALRKNCNVLIEKPITFKVNEAKTLYNLAKKKKKKIFVAFQNRYNPSVKKTKEFINKNKLGKIITVSARLRWCRYPDYYKDDWHGTWKLDGGVLCNQAIHVLDVLLWFFGPIERVYSVSKNVINKLEAEDTIISTLEFSNGIVGTIEATTGCRPKDYEVSLSIIGSKGIVEIDGLCLNKIRELRFHNNNKKNEIIKKKFSENIKMAYGNGHLHLLKEIFNKLEKKNFISLHKEEEIIRPIELINAIYKSSSSHKPISLKSKPKFNKLGS